LGIGGFGDSGMRRIGWMEIDVPEAEMVTKLRPYWKDMSTKLSRQFSY